MSKTVIIKRKNQSDWVSCQSITSNLVSCYNALQTDIKIIEIEEDSNKYSYWKYAKEINKLNPSRIIFIDHSPHPAQLVKSLFEFTKGDMPELIFHIFGDFTLQSSHWIEIESILKKTNIKLICASDKQRDLVNNLLSINKEAVSILPFPVNTEVFCFDEKRVKNDKFKFLYTGRLSDQKNILELINIFNHFNTQINPKTELYISGPYDDLGIPFLGKKMRRGTYGLAIESLVERLDNQNIKLLGNLSQEELSKQYSSSDAFISISTHNDEDYGMSPAEALCCGLPCILTNWAGYSSFKKYVKDGVLLSNVSLQSSKNLPNKSDIIKKMTYFSANKCNDNLNYSISNSAISHLSIPSVSKQLELILKKQSYKLNECNHLFKSLASSHIYTPDTPFLKASDGSYTTLYKEIYSPYYTELNYDE